MQFLMLVSLRNKKAKRLSVTNVTGLLIARFVRNSLNVDGFGSCTKTSV